MRHVLLADKLKSSLVMTSEIFKDRVKDCAIHIVGTGRECVNFLAERTPDMIVVDFDLPDTDGVMLSKYLRKYYSGPVIITAYPHRIVDEAIENEQFFYNDSSHWIKKPVRMEDFGAIIDQFLLGNRRIGKRYLSEHDVQVVGKSMGRGKRTPKVFGRTMDISMGGTKVCAQDVIPFQIRDDLTVKLTLSPEDLGSDGEESEVLKIKGHMAWKNNEKNIMGVCFHKISESQRSILEMLMKDQRVLPDQVDYLQCGS